MFPTSWNACRRASLVWQRISALFSRVPPSPSFVHALCWNQRRTGYSQHGLRNGTTAANNKRSRTSCLCQETRIESQREMQSTTCNIKELTQLAGGVLRIEGSSSEADGERDREGAPNDASEQSGAFTKTGAALGTKKLCTALHIHSHQCHVYAGGPHQPAPTSQVKELSKVGILHGLFNWRNAPINLARKQSHH